MAGVQTSHLSTIAWLGWLGLAIAAHFVIALFGVLSRYLQVKAQPPAPPLRLLLLISLLGCTTQLLFYTAPLFARRRLTAWRRARAKRRAATCGCSDAPDVEAAAAAGDHLAAGDGEAAAPAKPAAPADAPPAPAQHLRVPRPAKSTVRPEVPLSRGLSARFEGLQARRPRLTRCLALGGLTACGVAAGALQIGAVGMVDASLVQLIQMFTVLVIAVVQAGLLKHRIPVLLWPTALVMVAGAAMVIVPSIRTGSGTVGGLGTVKSYLGLAMAVGYMLCMATYFILLQATRHMGLSSITVQYYFMIACTLVLLPITLPLNGTDWTADMAPWTATDWVVLGMLGSVVCVGAGTMVQHATWKLGAPTVSLFYGLRLAFTVAQSRLILGATIIKTSLQVAGIVTTVAAVTAYMAWQWMHVRRAARAATVGTEEADEAGPEGSSPSTKKLEEDEEEGGEGSDQGSAAAAALEPAALEPTSQAAHELAAGAADPAAPDLEEPGRVQGPAGGGDCSSPPAPAI